MRPDPTAGLGFRPAFFDAALAGPAAGLWFEVHAENYMVEGGPRLAMLDALSARFPLSLHGVGLSLAGAERPCRRHLAALQRLMTRTGAALVSEHLAWSRLGAHCAPDLLPFPRTDEALDVVARNIDIVQQALSRAILVENPSRYLRFAEDRWSEPDFLAELVRRTGCGLLVDLTNIIVSANNTGFDPYAYVDALPAEAVGELHLAGHSADPMLGEAMLIDSHDGRVSGRSWSLFAYAIDRFGPRPTLIENDGPSPDFAQLMVERGFATAMLADYAPAPELAHA